MMVNIGILALAFMAGYVCATVGYFVITLLIAGFAPGFVANRGRFRSSYLFLSFMIWAACVAAGCYLAASASSFMATRASVEAGYMTWFPAFSIGGLLTLVVMANPLETKKQLGGIANGLMPLFTVAGTVAGYVLFRRH